MDFKEKALEMHNLKPSTSSQMAVWMMALRLFLTP